MTPLDFLLSSNKTNIERGTKDQTILKASAEATWWHDDSIVFLRSKNS